MKILLDECIPFPVKIYLEEHNYFVRHVKETEFEGLKNGKLYELATVQYNIFITNDKHFKHINIYPPTSTFGILYLRIAPNFSQFFIQGLNNLLSKTSFDHLIGKKVIVRRNDFEIL